MLCRNLNMVNLSVNSIVQTVIYFLFILTKDLKQYSYLSSRVQQLPVTGDIVRRNVSCSYMTMYSLKENNIKAVEDEAETYSAGH